MKVFIKDLRVGMEIKTAGVELEVRDTQDNHLGDLVITKTKLVWCKGRTQPQNGKTLDWEAFITMMDQR